MAQEKLGWMEMEVFMMTTGLSQGETVRYKMEALGIVWRAENTSPPSGYEFSNNHSVAYYPILTQSETGNTNFNNLSTIWGYNWMQPFITYNQSYDSIAHGLYKVSTSLSEQYFYLDYRDDRYNGSNIYRLAPGGLDIWILYNKNLDRFMYRKQGIQNPDPQYWIQVQKGDYIGLWTIKEVSNPTTGNFPDFWSNCLSVSNDGNNHPRLIWGPYPDDNFFVQYYKIYKKKGSSTFTVTHTTSDFYWVDTSEIMVFGPPQSNEGICYYKISAVGVQRGTSVETGVTNTVDTRVQGSNQEKLSSDTWESKSKKFALSQNYPNPFNPSTKIEYSIAENSFVSLKVYDILGNEVAELVNEYKSMGEYQIEFNAAEIPSGIYLYTLVSGNYISTKKLILLK